MEPGLVTLISDGDKASDTCSLYVYDFSMFLKAAMLQVSWLPDHGLVTAGLNRPFPHLGLVGVAGSLWSPRSAFQMEAWLQLPSVVTGSAWKALVQPRAAGLRPPPGSFLPSGFTLVPLRHLNVLSLFLRDSLRISLFVGEGTLVTHCRGSNGSTCFVDPF